MGEKSHSDRSGKIYAIFLSAAAIVIVVLVVLIVVNLNKNQETPVEPEPTIPAQADVVNDIDETEFLEVDSSEIDYSLPAAFGAEGDSSGKTK